LRNEIIEDIKQSKIKFVRRLAENIKVNTKSFYAYMLIQRGLLKKALALCWIKQVVGPIVSDSDKMGELLNDYFASVFLKEDLQFIPKASTIAKKNVDI